MISQNFFPLSKYWPALYEHASRAEQYIYSDPHAAIVKLRCYAELLVGEIYRTLKICDLEADDFYNRLAHEAFRQAVPKDVITKIHAMRKFGNSAAHGEIVASDQASILIKDAYIVGQWFYKAMTDDKADYPQFAQLQLPPAENRKDKPQTALLTQAIADLASLQEKEKQALSEIKKSHDGPDRERFQQFAQDGRMVAEKIDMQPEATSRLFNFKDAFADYELSAGQKELVKTLDHFLKGNEENVFLLKGYAGTGKTFITKGLVDYFKMTGRNFVLAAPTGKAAKVISKKAKAEAYTIHKTIYSFDDLKEYSVENEKGTETFKFYAQLVVNIRSADTVYIVDEASMISDKYQEGEFFRFGSGFLLKDFFKYVNLDHNDHRKKVIFIGDDAQLPPVGMDFSPALNAEYLQREYNVKTAQYMLTDVVRQKKDSGVLKNANELRVLLGSNYINKLEMCFDFPDIHETKYEDMIEAYLDACGRKINDDAILIMHSNTDVKQYNDCIREYFFPESQDEIRPGDKIMANSNNSSYGFFISNGDFGIVRKVFGDSETRTVSLKRKNKETGITKQISVILRFRNVEVGFKDHDGQAIFFNVKIIENLLYSDKPELNSDENRALYVDFCTRNPHIKRKSKSFKDALRSDPYFNALRLKFGYAITCHKAQGSEWKYVFVKCKNSLTGLNYDYLRWLYTAITRTVDELYLVDPPLFTILDGIKIVHNPGGLTAAVGGVSSSSVTGSDIVQTHGEGNAQATTSPVDSLDTFGISPQDIELLVILNAIRQAVASCGVQITDIKHSQYQEAYFFQREHKSSRINIAYNKKGLISSLNAQDRSDFTHEILKLLEPLKGKTLSSGNTNFANLDCNEPFLQEFHDHLAVLAAENNIIIQSVESLQWMQRYTFTRDNEEVIFDISYNGKHQFTTCQPTQNSYRFPSLVHDISSILTEGLRK